MLFQINQVQRLYLILNLVKLMNNCMHAAIYKRIIIMVLFFIPFFFFFGLLNLLLLVSCDCCLTNQK